jgi:HEAT repeat protein
MDYNYQRELEERSVMFSFKPSVARMKKRRDLLGLLKTLDYGKKRPTGLSLEEMAIEKQAVEALDSLVGPHDTAIVDSLIEMLETRNSGTAFRLLGKVGGPRIVDLLIRYLQHPSDSNLSEHAALALAITRDPRAAPALIEALRSNITSVR